jgi:tRNA G18 (ribose-2'-O)-methylase SpoU
MAQVIVALENIRSLFNIGAIFRTCEFFGVGEVFLVGYTGRERSDWNELHHKISKTALGAEKNLKIKFFRDSPALLTYVTAKKLPFVAIEQHPKSIALENWQPQPNSVLVFGSETEGVSPAILAAASQIVEIPRLGKKNSLNVATCAGIVINHATSAKIVNNL